MPRAAGGRPRKLQPGEFAKYHGLGNDYVVIDGRSFGKRLTAASVRVLCARHTGIGSDGILVLGSSRKADVSVRIYNPDGSEAEKSGNGVRILARFLHDFGYVRKKSVSIETKGGVVEAELLLRRGNVERIRVHMGQASFASREVPVSGPDREVVDEPLVEIGSRTLHVTCLSIGNPHCVAFVSTLSIDDLRRIGPLIEKHPSFPNRTNVQLARVRTRKLVEALIWERGAGETLASGSSACAVAAAAFRNDLVDPKVDVVMPGGQLSIEIEDDFEIRMTGPSTPVYRGSLL